MQNWSQYRAFGMSDSLCNSWRACLGGEYIPDIASISSYFKKVHYRFGLHYANTFHKLSNTQINDYGFGIGFVFPFKRSRTNLAFNIDVGQRGTTQKSLIKEQYARFTFCLNIYERWFFKRKYD
jgi:hypothetical protein